jgi:hypothetical protein
VDGARVRFLRLEGLGLLPAQPAFCLDCGQLVENYVVEDYVVEDHLVEYHVVEDFLVEYHLVED